MEILLTRKDVNLFRHLARLMWIDTACKMTLTDGTPIDDEVHRALCSFRAALAVLQSHGLLKDATIPTVEETSDPAVEDYL
jgi:hypothetical protein